MFLFPVEYIFEHKYGWTFCRMYRFLTQNDETVYRYNKKMHMKPFMCIGVYMKRYTKLTHAHWKQHCDCVTRSEMGVIKSIFMLNQRISHFYFSIDFPSGEINKRRLSDTHHADQHQINLCITFFFLYVWIGVQGKRYKKANRAYTSGKQKFDNHILKYIYFHKTPNCDSKYFMI